MNTLEKPTSYGDHWAYKGIHTFFLLWLIKVYFGYSIATLRRDDFNDHPQSIFDANI